ncbi:MAG TPA: ComEC/Rec2 family competence protein [Chthoniobacterales bacterium]|jgi:ComEC/Rec2-related protein
MNPPGKPRQPFVAIALTATVGILAAEWMAPALGGISFVVLGILALVSLWRPRTQLTLFLVAAAFFVLHVTQQETAPGRRLAKKLGERPRQVTVTGEVLTEPKAGTGNFVSFLLRLNAIEIGGSEQLSHATVRVRWKCAPELGDEIRLTGMAETIPPTRNPGAFDMRTYLARQDIYDSIFARYAEDGTILKSSGGNLVLRLAARSREWLQATLTHGLENSPDVCGLIDGMALGLRHETPSDIEQPFQQTGTLHLFAVAGLHVGIIAQLLWILGRLARLPRKTAAAIIIPFLFFYSAITGLHVSSLRAATMAAVLLGGIFFERRVLALNSLAAAAVLILAWDPNQLFAAGFQLSFAVVAAILVCQNKILEPLLRLSATDPFLPRSLVSRSRRFGESCCSWVARGVSVSAAAWIGSLLLIVWYFYLITPISLLANLVVVPIAFCILAVAMMSLLAAPFSGTLSVLFNNANWSLSHIVLALVQMMSQLPGGHLYVERPHWPSGARAEITVLDAGAGAAVHLRADGADWLLDTGSLRDYERFFRDYLHSRGIDRLNGLLLSHGDSLHLGGAAGLLEEFKPRRVLDNAAPDRSRVHHSLIVRLPHRELLAGGSSISIAPQIVARVLFPPPNFKAKAADDEALVVQLEIDGNFRVLLVSDSGAKTEAALLRQPNELRSDVLIKGRHYSGESGSEAFLAAVQPQLVIASSVDFPTRERVSDEWAAMIRARGIKLFREDETGAVRLDFFRDRWRATAFLTHETFTSSSR